MKLRSIFLCLCLVGCQGAWAATIGGADANNAINVPTGGLITQSGPLVMTPVAPHLKIGNTKAVTDEVATDFVRVGVAQGGHNHGTIWYSIFVAESGGGSDLQSMNGMLTFAAVNKAGTVACDVQKAFGAEAYAESSGPSSLTVAFACVEDAADTIDISANVNTSFAATTTLNFEYLVQTVEDYITTAL